MKALIKQGGGGGLLFSLCNCGNEPDNVKKKNSMFLAMFKFVFSAIALSKS